MRFAALAVTTVLLVAGCASSTDSGPEPQAPSTGAVVSPSSAPQPSTSSESATASLSTVECEQVWFDYQYGSLAPGFPVKTADEDMDSLYQECQDLDLLPSEEDRLALTQQAFNITAQILEKRISKVSKKTGQPPCAVLVDVLKPVAANGVPLQPGDDVEGYAADSYLPILKYNWYGGPFRLKWAVGCMEYPWANLWLFADPFPPAGDHPDRYPADKDVKKDPWPRFPVQGRMSTCITWGPELGNDGPGDRGYIFAFDWDRTNLPMDVRSCYPKALGLEGLDKFPFDVVPNLE